MEDQENKHKKKTIETEETMGIKKFIKTNNMNKVKIRFSDLPISRYTVKGLTKADYLKMTEVQR